MAQPPLIEILTKAAAYLKEKGVPQARLDAELLLARLLGVKRLDLYLQFDRPLTEPELAGYREFVRRRGMREPLQHIEGECAFRGLSLAIDGRALIPRPETELLVDAALKRLTGVASPRIVDIGTGSGAIALSVTQELLGSEVWAGDVSPECLELARENAAKNGLAEPRLFLGSLFDPFPADLRWHAVISNPPYIAARDVAGLEPEVRDHDPRNALVGGEAGWELPLALITAARERLLPGGFLILEIDPPQFSLLKEKIATQDWASVEGLPDYQQNDRFLLAQT